MKNVTPGPDDKRNMTDPPPGISSPTPPDDDPITEALAQISAITDSEDERRKTADGKLSSAQSAIGFIVTLAGGSVALAFLQTPAYDLWHGLIIVLLTVAVAFFVLAACKIIEANEPKAYQGRIAASVRRLLDEGKTTAQLQRDAIDDFVRNLKVNTETTNDRMGLYRAAIRNIRKGVIIAGLVPCVALLGYSMNVLWGARLPSLLRIPWTATPSPSTPKPTSTPLSTSSQALSHRHGT